MLSRVLIVLSAGLAVAGTVLLITTNVVPYEWVRLWLDRFAADGSADAYTRPIHLGIVNRLRYVGVASIGLGVIAYVTRQSLAATAHRLWIAASDLLHDVGRGVRALASEEPASLRLTLLAIVGTGIAIRWWFLDWPMRYDESFTYLNYAQPPLVLGLTRYDTPNNHLFHTFLVHVSYSLFGNAPWALRLPAFIAGVSVLPATYLAIRALYGGAAALWATAMMTVSMPAIEMSTNARGYSIVTLFFLLLVCLGTYLRASDNLACWFLFGGIGALGLYTIPTMVYAFATVVAWLLLSAWRGDVRVRPGRFLALLASSTAAAGMVGAMLYAPILIRTDLATLLASPIVSIKVEPVPWTTFVTGNADKVVDAWRRWTSDLPLWWRGVWLAGVVVALLRHARVGRSRIPLVAGVALACAPLLMLQRVIVPSRVWIFLLPICAGMGAAGVIFLLRWVVPDRWRADVQWRRLVVGTTLLLTVGGTLSVASRSRQYSYNLPDFPGAEKAVAFLAPQLRPGDKILVVGLSLTPFLYYCDLHGLPYLEYVFDYVLEGWPPLRNAERIFIVVNERKHTLAWVLEKAQLTDVGAPVGVTELDTGHIYVVARDRRARGPSRLTRFSMLRQTPSRSK